MNVRIVIPPSLRHLTNGQAEINVEGYTIKQSLDCLKKQFPGVDTALFDHFGDLRAYVIIAVNWKITQNKEMDKLINDGDELEILFLTGGG